MRWISLAIGLCALLFHVNSVLACSCFKRATITVEDLWENDLIFKGEVVRVSKVKSRDGDDGIKALFRISRSFIGVTNQDTISVFTNDGVGSCGLGFRVGEEWIIFAVGYKKFHASWCGHSRRQRTSTGETSPDGIVERLDSLLSLNQQIRQRSSSMGVDYDVVGSIYHGVPIGKWHKIANGDTIAWLVFESNRTHIKELTTGNAITETEKLIVDGELTLKYRTFTLDSVMNLVQQYKGDVKHGYYEQKFRGSKEAGEYFNGLKHGEWTVYTDGKLKTKKTYDKGRLTSSYVFDRDGNPSLSQ